MFLIYRKYIKRLLDIICALLALILLSPLFIILTIIGAIAMKGNPFFTQERPGYKEKLFKLIKFRTMTNEKDKDGNLLPDEKRLNGYGKFLRSTSLDEFPEAINILKGDMSVIGPRPLLVEYPHLMKTLIPKFILISLIPSLFILRYYLLNLKYDKTGRGIVISTFVLGLVFVIVQFAL